MTGNRRELPPSRVADERDRARTTPYRRTSKPATSPPPRSSSATPPPPDSKPPTAPDFCPPLAPKRKKVEPPDAQFRGQGNRKIRLGRSGTAIRGHAPEQTCYRGSNKRRQRRSFAKVDEDGSCTAPIRRDAGSAGLLLTVVVALILWLRADVIEGACADRTAQCEPDYAVPGAGRGSPPQAEAAASPGTRPSGASRGCRERASFRAGAATGTRARGQVPKPQRAEGGRIERATSRGEEGDAREPASDLEAAAGDALVRDAVGGEV